MIDFFRNLNLDRLSFWIGFVAGSLFWWFLGSLRPYLRRGWKALRAQLETTREGLSSGTEIRLANDTLRRVQRLHLAAPLFSLDEIRIQPRVLVPAPKMLPGVDPPFLDIVDETLPYLPEWPELACTYGTHTLSLPEAMSQGANLALIGRPGAGKTFALADLASQVARRSPEALDLANLIPLYIHVFDLDPALDEGRDALEALTEAVSEQVSLRILRQVPKLLQTAMHLGRVLLLLDGLDELTPDQIDAYVAYLRHLKEDFPSIRMAVAASTEYLDGLLSLGLAPVSVGAWNNGQRVDFIQRWGMLWTKYINPDTWPPEPAPAGEGDDREISAPGPVDPLMIEGWLLQDRSALNPLETTLKVWAAYAGDMRGPSSLDAINAYLLRMAAASGADGTTLEQLAFRMVMSNQPIIARESVDQANPGPALDADLGAEVDGEVAPATSSPVSVRRELGRLVNSGLLTEWEGGRLTFVHPVFIGYLCALAMRERGGQEKLLAQPKWIGRSLTLQYLAACGDVSHIAAELMEASEDPIQEELLAVASWVRWAPKKASWKAIAMRRLARLLQNEVYPLSLRARALAALATSGEADVAVLFRHLLNSDRTLIRQMAALGAGYVRDNEAVEELAVKLYDPTPTVRRAAALALVNIGSEAALEHVASALVSGDEDLRRAAAEAFANHPQEGFPLLEEGAELDDLLVRRAVVFGLKRIGDPWAVQLLQKMQLEDGQWVVRNAATQALEELDQPDAYIPRPLPPLHEAPWLIAFAGERGMGVTSGKSAWEMLKRALKEGTVSERLAAMPYLYLNIDTGDLLVLYNLFYGADDELREATYDVLWHLNTTGIKLPSPTQYGLGS